MFVSQKRLRRTALSLNALSCIVKQGADCRKERHFHIRRASPSSTNVKIESAMFKVLHTFTTIIKKKLQVSLQEFATIPFETVKINSQGFFNYLNKFGIG